MRAFSKEVVLKFDDAVKASIPEKDILTFIEVANTIMELINNKKIYKPEISAK